MADSKLADGSPRPEPSAPAARNELLTLLVVLLASAVLLMLCLSCGAFWLYN
ncbi:hypothetical protein [Micromonospora sp. NPDC005806]|uniref:hypothetical protein n=1 Tax=Micromonospora sp. NPDC005806 TaxID=3364234 RepID=UPI0036A3E895